MVLIGSYSAATKRAMQAAIHTTSNSRLLISTVSSAVGIFCDKKAATVRR
jgi:hypothetical protein